MKHETEKTYTSPLASGGQRGVGRKRRKGEERDGRPNKNPDGLITALFSVFQRGHKAFFFFFLHSPGVIYKEESGFPIFKSWFCFGQFIYPVLEDILIMIPTMPVRICNAATHACFFYLLPLGLGYIGAMVSDLEFWSRDTS